MKKKLDLNGFSLILTKGTLPLDRTPQRGVTIKFFRVGGGAGHWEKLLFPNFSRRDFGLFPVEIFTLVDTKTSFSGFL